jgi:GNAT superfamily N-acetyltransferase
MGVATDLTMREAGTHDVPAIAAMRKAVGWSAHDWALRAVIGQPHARCVVSIDEGGRIAGVGSGIAYGRLGFIGNMIVAEEHRRRGIGTAILDDLVTWLAGRGCHRLELNATDEGRELYARNGFVSRGASAVARVPRSADLETDPSSSLRPAMLDDLDALAAYDLPRFGGDRRPILAMLLADPSCRSAIAERDGTLVGLAIVRPDEPRLGPLVADTPEVAASLLSWAFEAVPTADEMRLNLPPGNEPGADWLRFLGVDVQAWDGRMARGPDIPRSDETIYQMTVGPLG